MRVIVTGGSGFIGSAVVSQAVQYGMHVANLDWRMPRIRSQNKYWNPVNLLDATATEEAIRRFSPDFVIHLAAESVIPVDERELNYGVNVETSHNVFSSCFRGREIGVVFASTELVHSLDTVEPLDSPLHRNLNHYAASKAHSESELLAQFPYAPWVICRPTYVWGEFSNARFRQVLRQISRRRYLLPKGVVAHRSYSYVRNAADQLLQLALRDQWLATYLIADETIPIAQFVDGLSQGLTGKPCRRVPISLLRALAALGDHVPAIPFDSFRLANITKSRFHPELPPLPSKVSLPDAQASVIRWYLGSEDHS